MTLKHGGESGPAKRARVETDDSAAVAEQDEGLDWDLTGDVDQEYERRWQAEERDIHENDRELAWFYGGGCAAGHVEHATAAL